MKITVTQINWNGNGDDRHFDYWPARGQLEAKLERIAWAYHFAGGRTRVEVDGVDVTDYVAAMKP